MLILVLLGHAGWRAFSTTTGLFSAERPLLVLVVAVDKDGKGSDELTEIGGDGRKQVANPEFVIGPNPHKQSKIITSAGG